MFNTTSFYGLFLYGIAWFAACYPALAQPNPPLAIDAEYAGGNIVVEKIEGDTVFLQPDLRDTDGWWFYWNFRVNGAAGRTLTFRFNGKDPIGVRGPAVSRDGGITWSWLGKPVVEGRFRYAFSPDATETRFAFAIPYLQSNLREFLAAHERSPSLAVEKLCTSRTGRDVEMLRVGRLDGEAPFRVLVTARHHACESMASFALEGDFHRDIRGAKIRFWGAGNVDDPEAAAYMDGFALTQTGNVGDITAGLPPQDYSTTPYVEWYGADNGRVVLELEPSQVEVVGTPIPACESEPISSEKQAANMAEFMTGVARALRAAKQKELRR